MRHFITSFFIVSNLALLALLAGCAATEPSQSGAGAKLPNAGGDGEYSVDFPDPGHGVARYIRLTLSEDLSRSCGLMQTYFDFDSDKLSPQDEATLRTVAACLEKPELRDTKLAIVGRTDSRGSADYNTELGQRRAESVKKLLVSAGIQADRIGISSRGDAEAAGSDTGKSSHGYDRRVDVVLVGVVRTPL